MQSHDPLVLLVEIGGIRCALPVDGVDEVLPAASIVPLPDAPASVMGVLNVRGDVVVVVDGAACLGVPRRPMAADDHLVVLRGDEIRHAVRVDSVDDVTSLPAERLHSRLPVPGAEATVALLDDGMLLVCEPAAFVSAEDAASIRAALERSGEEPP